MGDFWVTSDDFWKFLFLMMFDVKFYFHSVLLPRASGISGMYICVVIALWIAGELFVASNDFVKFIFLGGGLAFWRQDRYLYGVDFFTMTLHHRRVSSKRKAENLFVVLWKTSEKANRPRISTYLYYLFHNIYNIH